MHGMEVDLGFANKSFRPQMVFQKPSWKLWKAYSSNDKIPVWIPAVLSDEVYIYPQIAI